MPQTKVGEYQMDLVIMTHGGRWNHDEKICAKCNYTNYLGLWIAFMALRAYSSNDWNTHIKLEIDNITAVAYINHMGRTKSTHCNVFAKEVWEWCIHRKIWITAYHLAGVLSTITDKRSHKFRDQTEWQLDRKVFW